MVVSSTLKKSSIAGNPIVNINNESAANNTITVIVFASLPPGSFLQIHEYISIAPRLLGSQVLILALDQLGGLQ
jgi:hypothetical protein